MVEDIITVNVDYENISYNKKDDLEIWAMYNCDGFLGTYRNWISNRPIGPEHKTIKTFYFDNERSAILFALRWL